WRVIWSPRARAAEPPKQTMKTSILRLFSTSLCVTALAACGDDGSGITGATLSNTTVDSSDPTTPGNTTPGGNSNSESDTDAPTTGDSAGETLGTTDGPTTTDTTPVAPECGNGVQEGGEECDDGND